jgi:hypothetical protein
VLLRFPKSQTNAVQEGDRANFGFEERYQALHIDPDGPKDRDEYADEHHLLGASRSPLKYDQHIIQNTAIGKVLDDSIMYIWRTTQSDTPYSTALYCPPRQSDHQDDILSSSQMMRWS